VEFPKEPFGEGWLTFVPLEEFGVCSAFGRRQDDARQGFWRGVRDFGGPRQTPRHKVPKGNLVAWTWRLERHGELGAGIGVKNFG
jgi:hypothetical protein